MKLPSQPDSDAHLLHTSTPSQLSAAPNRCEHVQETSRGEFDEGLFAATYPMQVDDEDQISRKRPISANDFHIGYSTDMVMGISYRFQGGLSRIPVTAQGLQEFLTSEELNHLQIEASNLTNLWCSSPEPPITRFSLSELDLNRIINYPKLRHDLNFEQEISFRPDYSGNRGDERKLYAKQYWDMLAIEFAIYIVRQQRLLPGNFPPLDPWLLGPSRIPTIPWRLPRMFETLRDILKTLVPSSQWSVVDQRLDTDLLLQELDNDACDLEGLSGWLGNLLLGSCSPLRDSSVAMMVQKIQLGVKENNARTLVDGLSELFAILEMMKLDVANHQIRNLRFLMIDDTVHFEQKYFLHEIEAGRMEVLQSKYWYDVTAAHEERPHRLAAFTRAILDLIVEGESRSIPTFIFDFDRLRILEGDFCTSMYQVICEEAFVFALHKFGYKTMPSNLACQSLQCRLTEICGSGSSNSVWFDDSANLALEIVKEAYKLCSIKTVPTEAAVSDIEGYLLEKWDNGSDLYKELERLIRRDLEGMVDQEVEATVESTPLQILNHHKPAPALPEPKHVHDRLRSIARRVAHIAILNWRVWGPILYHQPGYVVCNDHGPKCGRGESCKPQLVPENLPEDKARTASRLPSCTTGHEIA